MYTGELVADITEQSKETVYYHIKQGYLKATKVSNSWQITQTDLNNYMKDYLYSDTRFKTNQRKMKLNKKEVHALDNFFQETKKCNTLEDLILKFASQNIEFPSLQLFERWKTNQEILKDYEKGLNYEQLQAKHNVSSRTIYNVITNHKEIQS